MIRKVLSVLLTFTVIIFAGCSKDEETHRLSLKERRTVSVEPDDTSASLRFAVGGMITPKEGLAYYKDFLDYISEKTGQPVKFVDRDDYGEINAMLENNELDLAFVCSGPYVDGHEKFGLELLVAPDAYGGQVYHSYIIVNKDSPIKSFAELRGKDFAFTDPLSNTGKLVPTYMLARIHETPESFFKSYKFSRSHDNSIKAVAEHLVDGAAVDSLIWQYLDQTNNEHTFKTRIVEKSPPYGIPPVVVTRSIDPVLKEKLRQIFLDTASDPKGREILDKMMIDRFVAVEDRHYDSVREMKDWLKQQSR